MTVPPRVIIYTDGSCIGNPGPGGWAAILLSERHGATKELSGGEPQHTTNNRMELRAAIAGLQALKKRSSVELRTDSSYVVGLGSGKTHARANRDLAQQLRELCSQHEVRFAWIRGHAGDPLNERCDYLAMDAALNAQQEQLA